MKRKLCRGCALLIIWLFAGRSADAAPLNIEMVPVKGGCYKMGSNDGVRNEKPVHEVCVNDFSIGKYEVTQAQWETVMGSNPSRFKNCGPECPVEYVSWNDVQGFIKKLNAQTGRQYRLPTEAEWEYAARAGASEYKWAGVNDEERLPRFAWYEANSGEITHKAGLKKPNGLGIYDMSGNVWEWCQDWYEEGYYEESPKNNPTGPEKGEFRVLRGGSWGHTAASARVTYRARVVPSNRFNDNGLRLVLP